MKGTTTVESQGHVAARGEVKQSKGVIEPSYNYINTVAMDSGMGRLSASLTYTAAIANMEMHIGSSAMQIGSMEYGDAMKSGEDVLAGADYLLQKNSIKMQKRQSILEQQKQFFDGITLSNTMAAYQENISAFERKDLNDNPGGEGHMQRMAASHDNLVKEYLTSTLDPGLKSHLVQYFRESAQKVASRAFDQEQTRTQARAELALERSIENANMLVAKGINPEEALRTLDPVMERIPNSMPWKAEAAIKARKKIIKYSLLHQAIENPELAQANIRRGGIYSEISSETRLEIERMAQAALKDRSQKNNEKQLDILAKALDILAKALDDNSSEFSKYNIQIANGSFGYAQLQAARSRLSGVEYKFLRDAIINRHKAMIADASKQVAIETKANAIGSYAASSAEEQKNIWYRKLQTKEFTYNGKPADATNEMMAQAEFAKKFTAELPLFKNALKMRMFEGNAAQCIDAAKAFADVYANNRVVLGSTNDPDIKAMLLCSSYVNDGFSIKKAQKAGKDYLTPILPSDLENITSSFEDLIESGSSVLHDVVEKYGTKITANDRLGRYALKIARNHYINTRGNLSMTAKLLDADLASNYRPASVNGKKANDFFMLGSPDVLLSGEFKDPYKLRKVFNARAKELAPRYEDTEKKYWVELLNDEDIGLLGAYNECFIHDTDGSAAKGYYWYDSVPGERGKYYVKYSKTPWFGFYSFDAGEYITDNSDFPQPIIVDIEDLKY